MLEFLYLRKDFFTFKINNINNVETFDLLSNNGKRRVLQAKFDFGPKAHTGTGML